MFSFDQFEDLFDKSWIDIRKNISIENEYSKFDKGAFWQRNIFNNGFQNILKLPEFQSNYWLDTFIAEVRINIQNKLS